MTGRIEQICAVLSRAHVFADIGCDHGYCTRYMLENALCDRAYISDISALSLEKAKTLLHREVAAGTCIPVVADGLDGIPEPCDLVLIAGMGGEEIIKILSRKPLPKRYVLQPMKNSDKVRRYLLQRGARIERDFTFSEGVSNKKFYDLIAGCACGGDTYTEREILYGRDNLRGQSEVFLEKLTEERQKLAERLTNKLGAESRKRLSQKLMELEEITREIIGTL